MKPEDQRRWKDEVLSLVFRAMVAHEPLRDALIFKGARILNLHLGVNRQSLDIDSNVAPELVASRPDLGEQAGFLSDNLGLALRRYFERQDPVRFSLVAVRIDKKPPKNHPQGWDAFLLRVELRDSENAGVLGLPRIEIDVAALETLGPDAIEEREVDGHSARVYSLHRIAGEKLRAYLTSLPAYRAKMKGGERDFRVKDLFDIARILRARPIGMSEFWKKAGGEFRLACESRLVECNGIETFLQSWDLARQRYNADGTLREIPFSEAEAALHTVVDFLNTQAVFPLGF